jgi:dihydrodipicolinate synthase/N-acetylneuraminate lyase
MNADAGLLAALESLQARFIQAVRSGDWPAAQDLERQRFALMDALTRERPPDAETLAALASVAEADRALRPLVEAALADCGAALRQLRRRREAAAAYATA